MRSSEEINGLIKQFNSDRSKTFAEFIAELFKGKLIEIYMGDSFEEVSVEQISTSYPAVFCGKVVGAYKECLILDAQYTAHTSGGKVTRTGNIVFLNERGIRGLTEIDGQGTMNDLFVKSGRESAELAKG